MISEDRIGYLKQLNHPEVEVRRQAILNLGETDDPHIFKILSSSFSDSHPAIRGALLRVFCHHKTRRKAEIVADTLYSPQLSVKSLAMEILNKLGSESIFPLKRLTRYSNPDLRKIAVELLGDINNPTSAAILLELINDPDEKVLLAVIDSLGKQKEIRAVPRLTEFYEKYEKQRPAILGSLTKIFLHWEKHIVRSELLDTDPALAFSFVNSVQENGNASALNLIIHWLENDNIGMEDEVLKALAVILENNPLIILPTHLNKTIKNIWSKYAEEMPLSVFLTCISRLPNNASLDILIRYYEQNRGDKAVEDALLYYVSRFPAIFFNRYVDIDMSIRVKILNLLIKRDASVYDEQIIPLYNQATQLEEKNALLKLAAMNGMLEAKQVLLSRLSNNGKKHVADILEYLLYYNDNSLWQLYIKYINDPEKAVQEKAFQGTLQYPEKTLEFVTEKLAVAGLEPIPAVLSLALMLPIEYAERFFNGWLAEPDEFKLASLKSYFIETGNIKYLLLIVRILIDHPAIAERFFSSLKEANLTITLPETMKAYLQKLPIEEQRQILQLSEKFWKEEIGNFLTKFKIELPGINCQKESSEAVVK